MDRPGAFLQHPTPAPSGWTQQSPFSRVELTADDHRRAAELVLTYEDVPLGTTDGIVIAVCERLGLSDVATVDRRHVTVVRPHVKALTLLPE